MSSILKIKDKNGNWIDIPAIIGLSAYEVAVKHGYNGTEEEWLESLKGTTPHIGANGNWFFGDIDSGVKADWESTIDTIESTLRNHDAFINAEMPAYLGELRDLVNNAPKDAEGSMVEVASNEELNALGEELKALEDLEARTERAYINGWTNGTIYNGTHQGSARKAYTEVFNITNGTQIHFDDSTYKICFVLFADDGTTFEKATSWMTTSPALCNYNYSKCRIEITTVDNSNIDVAAIENTVYYELVSLSKLVETVLAFKPKAECVYVDGVNGSDQNTGTKESPFATIQKGIDSNVPVVYVASGEYRETVRIDNRDNITIQPTTYPNFDKTVPQLPLIRINGENTRTRGMQISDCGNVTLINIHCDYCLQDCFYIKNVSNLEVLHCVASNNTETDRNGFKLYNVNGVIRDSLAYNIVRDGFNIHGYGYTEFINCVAYDCGDDGISHHDGCTGLILGGEYYRCQKGGVSSPTYGADITIKGVYSHDNAYGIYAVSSISEGYAICKGKIIDCVLKNNTKSDLNLGNAEIVGWGNIYDSKSIGTGATFTEY